MTAEQHILDIMRFKYADRARLLSQEEKQISFTAAAWLIVNGTRQNKEEARKFFKDILDSGEHSYERYNAALIMHAQEVYAEEQRKKAEQELRRRTGVN